MEKRSLSQKDKNINLGIKKILSEVIHIPIEMKKEINNMLYRFIWNGKTEKVSHNILM